ncbi:MAG TPA: hypothetical protein VMG41_01405 [Gemmatimonadales bacterium]|nr:hypothetical protein [Gemmatimonadales bacterium]
MGNDSGWRQTLRRAASAGWVIGTLVRPLVPPARAQMPVDHVAISVSGLATGTRVDGVPGGGTTNELKLEQSMLGLHGSQLHGHLRFSAAVSADRQTIPDGVLTLGAWGQGLYDREHPHAYLHEAVASLVGDLDRGRGQLWLAGGKGYVPFGSDPWMDGPTVHGPVNEHWVEIEERALITLGLRLGRVGIEGSLFDGTEGTVAQSTTTDTAGHQHGGGFIPEPPPRAGFGHSHAVRVIWRPLGGLELRGSVATIRSPEHHAGAGPGDEQVWNLSGQVARPTPSGHFGARVTLGRAWEGSAFWTAEAQGEWQSRGHLAYYRLERTDRPEGPRTADLFHSALDTLNAPVGATRWTVHTAGYSFTFLAGALRLAPVVELAVAQVASVATPAVNVRALYGGTTLWSGVIAVRVSLGRSHAMGHYGVDPAEAGMAHGH